MSFFDEVETTVANTRLIHAMDEKGRISMPFEKYEDLEEYAGRLEGKLTLEKLLEWNSVEAYQFGLFLKETKVLGADVFTAINVFARGDKKERLTSAASVYEKAVAFFGTDVHQETQTEENKQDETQQTTETKQEDIKVSISHTEIFADIKKKMDANRYYPVLFDTLKPCFIASFAGQKEKFIGSEHYKRYVQVSDYMRRPLSMNDFQVFRTLGRGAFGAVSACQKNETQHLFAIKEMSKQMVKKNKSEWVVSTEKSVLSKMNSPFVLSLKYSFHDSSMLYLAFDICTGGDLKFHLRMDGKVRHFNNKRAQFHAAEVLLGLHHMHSKGFLYRDLKPDNIMLTETGHCVVSDMGLCAKMPKPPKKLKHLAGTAGYWAPEIVSKQGTFRQSDYWSWAVFLYEMLNGKRPQCTCTDSKVDWCPFGYTDEHEKNAIKAEGVLKLNLVYPPCFNADCKSLLQALFDPDPDTRLGAGGVEEIKAHPYFANIDWERLQHLDLEPPFVPESNTVNAESIGDVGNFNKGTYRSIKLDEKDTKRWESFDYMCTSAATKEYAKALEVMDNQPDEDPNEDNGANSCCVLL